MRSKAAYDKKFKDKRFEVILSETFNKKSKELGHIECHTWVLKFKQYWNKINRMYVTVTFYIKNFYFFIKSFNFLRFNFNFNLYWDFEQLKLFHLLLELRHLSESYLPKSLRQHYCWWAIVIAPEFIGPFDQTEPFWLELLTLWAEPLLFHPQFVACCVFSLPQLSINWLHFHFVLNIN